MRLARMVMSLGASGRPVIVLRVLWWVLTTAMRVSGPILSAKGTKQNSPLGGKLLLVVPAPATAAMRRLGRWRAVK